MSTREDYKQEVIRLAARMAELEEALKQAIFCGNVEVNLKNNAWKPVVERMEAVLAKGGKS